MAKWTARSYWNFLGAAKDDYGLDTTQAKELYRVLRDEFRERGIKDGKLTAGDLGRHPRLAAAAIEELEEEIEAAVVPPTEPLEVSGYEEIEAVEEPEEYEIPAGEEWELTLTTKGHTPRKRGKK